MAHMYSDGFTAEEQEADRKANPYAWGYADGYSRRTKQLDGLRGLGGRIEYAAGHADGWADQERDAEDNEH